MIYIKINDIFIFLSFAIFRLTCNYENTFTNYLKNILDYFLFGEEFYSFEGLLFFFLKQIQIYSQQILCFLGTNQNLKHINKGYSIVLENIKTSSKHFRNVLHGINYINGTVNNAHIFQINDKSLYHIITKLLNSKKRGNYNQLKDGCWNLIYDFYNILMDKIPFQINYQRIYPRGFPSVYKQWINDPLTGNKTWANNDIVRFNFINPKKGAFDPYRSFIQITVSTNQTDLPVGLLQVDNSAHSFISQLVLYSKNREIERITQYDVLLAYLNDIGLNQFLSQGRQIQGLGYGSFDTMPYNKPASFNMALPRRCTKPQNLTMTVGMGTVNPTIGNCFPEQIQFDNQNSIFNCSRSVKGHVSNSNCVMTGNDWNGGNGDYYNKTGIQACMGLSGWANNLRTDYTTPFISSKYPEHTQSVPLYQLIVTSDTNQNGTYPYKYVAGKSYDVTVRTTYKQKLYFDQTNSQQQHYVNCSNFGFTSLFSPYFCRGAFQPIISPTVPQSMLQNGEFLKTKIPILRRKFKIPLASAVIGSLIDQSSYMLIPLQAINDCLLQLTLSPFAMFTSGYNDFCQFDDWGMGIQQKRNWSIDRIQYKIHTYFFVDAEVQLHIKNSLYKQITVVSNFWQLSNQFQIQGGAPVNNSYIVGCNSLNLNQLVCLFLPNDYQKYSFCRKQYRISNNITQYWSKLSTDYYPPQPFKGNGGNPTSNDMDGDNSIFIENLYWANNYMFSKNSMPRINPYNFAVNDRPYDPTNRNTFYDLAMKGNQAYSFTSRSVNGDTALGMPYIHENRVIGKAAYIIPYTPFIQQQNLLQGINVSGLSNFEVVFNSLGTNTFPRDQTLYIYCKSSVIIKYTADGITTIGR